MTECQAEYSHRRHCDFEPQLCRDILLHCYLGHVKSSNVLILGTLRGVKPAERTRTAGERKIGIKGFSFSVRVREV